MSCEWHLPSWRSRICGNREVADATHDSWRSKLVTPMCSISVSLQQIPMQASQIQLCMKGSRDERLDGLPHSQVNISMGLAKNPECFARVNAPGRVRSSNYNNRKGRSEIRRLYSCHGPCTSAPRWSAICLSHVDWCGARAASIFRARNGS